MAAGQADSLAFLTELSQVVASNTELQPILDWMVQKTTAMFGADEGSVRLLGQEPSPVLRTLVRKDAHSMVSGSWPPGIAIAVMGYLMSNGEPLATPDLTADPRFAGLQNANTRIRSVLAVPLKVDNRLTGMLAVTQTTPGRAWTREEIQLLSIVASSSAGAIEQARLRAESVEKQRLEERLRREERDLELARDIQMRLLPTGPLRFGPWEACGRVAPARQVGGDGFDCFSLDGSRFAVAIADVSGKGVPASLLMASFQASLRAYCDGRQPLAAGLGLVNRALARTVAHGQFVTAFCAEIDTSAGVLRYANAGHIFPLLRRADGALVELAEGGLPLGAMEDASYTALEMPFAAGDRLLLFSDGVTEAFNTRGEEYGEKRLREAWTRLGIEPPETAMAKLFDEVTTFRGNAEQGDDMTLVVVGAARP